jgi:hypothetical protein
VWYNVFTWLGWELVLPSDLASLLSFIHVRFRWRKKGEVRFLINLTICYAVFVEIMKCSHLFGEGDICAPVGGYG